MEKIDKKLQGKQNRAKGARFELKVRKELEEQGWIVDKWTNNVDLDKQMIIKAKSNRFRLSSTGFPDFLAFMEKSKTSNGRTDYRVILVECKVNGRLSTLEKEKMEALRLMGMECWVAYNENRQTKYRKLVEYKKRLQIRREQIRHRIG